MNLKSNILKKILGESAIVSGTEYFAFGVIFFTSLLINRNYGTIELGNYNLAITIAQLLILSIGGAFSIILRRDITLFPTKLSLYTNQVFFIRVSITLILLCIGILLCFFPIYYSKPFFYYLTLLILSRGIDSCTETFLTVYQTTDRISKYTLFKGMNSFMLLIGVLVISFYKFNIVWIYIYWTMISLLFVVVNMLYTHSKVCSLRWGIDVPVITQLIRETWPLFINSILFQLNSRGCIVIISLFLTTEVLGVYTAGITLISIFTAFVSSLAVVFFPYLTKAYKERPDLFMSSVNKMVFGMTFLGVIIFGVFLILTPYIIKIYGHFPFNPSNLFRILSFAIVPMVSTGILGYLFTILHKQKQGMFAAGIVLIINFSLFFIFTSFANVNGATWAYLISQLITGLVTYFWIYLLVKIDVRERRNLAV